MNEIQCIAITNFCLEWQWWVCRTESCRKKGILFVSLRGNQYSKALSYDTNCSAAVKNRFNRSNNKMAINFAVGYWRTMILSHSNRIDCVYNVRFTGLVNLIFFFKGVARDLHECTFKNQNLHSFTLCYLHATLYLRLNIAQSLFQILKMD